MDVQADTAPQVREQLDVMGAEISRYVPAIAPHFASSATLREYGRQRPVGSSDAVHERRRERLFQSVMGTLRSAFGRCADNLGVTPQTLRCVNVVDHHQLLNHPLLLGSNVVANAEGLLDGGPPSTVFSCSNIGPSNHYMRRGLQFKGVTVPYFAAKEHRDAVYYLPPRRFDFVERQRQMGRWQDWSEEDREFWTSFQDRLNGLDYRHCTHHRDQVTVAVRDSWPLLFAGDLRSRLPELLYVNSEDVFGRFLGDAMQEESFITAAILDPSFRALVLERLDGVFGAWDSVRDKGTHLFWRRHPRSLRLVRMREQGDCLVPTDRRLDGLAVPLEREALREALGREEIIPSVALWISILLFAGVTPLVGPNSLIYTTQLKERWASLLEAVGEDDEAALLNGLSTDYLIAGMPLFFSRRGGEVEALGAADLIAAGGAPEAYLDGLFETGLSDLLAVGAPVIHDLFEGHAIPAREIAAPKPPMSAAAAAVHTWL